MSYRHKSYFTYGDVKLSDYDAFAFYCNIFDKPVRDVSTLQIPGKDGDIVLDNGRFNNVDRVYIVQIHGIANANRLLGVLSAMTGYNRLVDGYEPDFYFEAKIKSVNVDRWVGEYVKATIVFDRKPYKMYLSGEIPATISSIQWNGSHQYFTAVYSLNNPGEIAFPLIELTPFRNNDTVFHVTYTWRYGPRVDIGRSHQSPNPDLVPKWNDDEYTYVLDCEKKVFHKKDYAYSLMSTRMENSYEECYPYIRKGTNLYYDITVFPDMYNGQTLDPMGDDPVVAYPVLYPRWRTL